ncbi:MAG: hypothetical protein OWS74_02815, partial [Firmicutes bacterium]|nr:hypothetical protein [Bacillota bacterium]
MPAEVLLNTPHEVVVRLSVGEELLSFHRSFHIPCAHIVDVRAEPLPTEWEFGRRMPGIGSLSVKTVGTFMTDAGKVFYDF